MKILEVLPDYTMPGKSVALMFVHSRNLYYVKEGINLTVLNFKAKENYILDGIQVITLSEYKRQHHVKYDILICHAPNIRNHYLFLKKYENKFSKIVFFFHGHEVVRINATYPKQYEHFRRPYSKIKYLFQDIYDLFKLKLWNYYFIKLAYKSHFVFVSKSLYNEFLFWTKINPIVLKDKISIIHNSVGKIFEENNYCQKDEKLYEFITIRSNYDSSVYCIDIVKTIAENNPNMKFLVIGKGTYFNYNKKPDNIVLVDKYLNHEELLRFINQSKCALMPTSRDTQGVMSCELATYGIPLITSNIPICHEIFDGFKNVHFIENNDLESNLNLVLENAKNSINDYTNDRYYYNNTVKKEIELLTSI